MKKRSLSITCLSLLFAIGASFQTLAQTATPTPTGTITPYPAPTRTATPTNLSETLQIDLSDDFSPDLIAGLSIGTGGQEAFLNCVVTIQNGAIVSDFGPQEVQDIPDFREMLPSICSDAPIQASDVQVYTPNANQVQAAFFSQPDENDTSRTVYVAAFPLGAFLTRGQWRIVLNQPVHAEVVATMPPITLTIFLRGAQTTGILAGFRPNEQVRAFAYDAINGGQDGWQYSKSFQFGVNEFGFRVLSLARMQTQSIVFIGQQGSVYISNATYQGNGSSQDARTVNGGIIQNVWAAQPGTGNNTGATNVPPSNTTERTDFHGVVQVYVPAGCFTMGSDQLGDINNQIKGQSARQVCLSQPYWIDKYEVSNAQWEQFRLETGSQLAYLDNYQTSTQPDTPRVGMTLEQAKAYAQWRGGWIPTEAQWEYAARGPSSPLYPWGNQFNGQANVYGTAGGTVSVSRYPEGASWVGAFNMAGNAGEWVSDCYSAAYDAQLVMNDPVSPCDGSNEMVKSSSFAFNSYTAQSAYRFVNPPGKRWFDVGLRVVSPA
ncbi:MAG: SUMF1/EgtB/PvdO family nonheme iron enzyme [Anaerolineaceae bacterium]|nr:SUMF1/EgtB/PvdO family nonheme iron enzyme [Anaerolineaceae bacterium]